MFRAGSGLRAVARRAEVPWLRRAFGGRLHMEVGAEARASGTGAQQKRESRAGEQNVRERAQSSRRRSQAREGPRSGGSPAHRAHGHWAEGRDDSLATLVQFHITKAELRRAREAPIVEEQIRTIRENCTCCRREVENALVLGL